MTDHHPVTAPEPGLPLQNLIWAVGRYQRAEAAEPHAHADAEYAAELVALAARDLVRDTEANHRERGAPTGWPVRPQPSMGASWPACPKAGRGRTTR